MTETARRYGSLLVAGLLVLSVSFNGSARAHDRSPGVSAVIDVPALLIADVWVTGERAYFITARRERGSETVHVNVSRYSVPSLTGPLATVRELFEYDAPSDALVISDNFRRATLDVDVPGVGAILVNLELYGVDPAPRYECQNYPWMYVLSAPFGEIARADWVDYSGSIAGSPITASFCRTYARNVQGGFWYSTPIWI